MGFSIKGINGYIEIFDDHLILYKTEIGFNLKTKITSEKVYFLKSISALEFKAPSKYFNGYLKIVSSDPNSLPFSNRKQNENINSIILRQSKTNSAELYTKAYQFLLSEIRFTQSALSETRTVNNTQKKISDDIDNNQLLKQTQVGSNVTYSKKNHKFTFVVWIIAFFLFLIILISFSGTLTTKGSLYKEEITNSKLFNVGYDSNIDHLSYTLIEEYVSKLPVCRVEGIKHQKVVDEVLLSNRLACKALITETVTDSLVVNTIGKILLELINKDPSIDEILLWLYSDKDKIVSGKASDVAAVIWAPNGELGYVTKKNALNYDRSNYKLNYVFILTQQDRNLEKTFEDIKIEDNAIDIFDLFK